MSGTESKLGSMIRSADAVVNRCAGLRVNGKVSSKRTQDYSREMIWESCRRLHRLGFYLEDVSGLQKKHIDALVKSWYSQPMAPKTIQNQFSRLKIFCGWIGKKGIVSPAGAIGHLPDVDPASLKVQTYTNTSKSWSGNGVDVVKKIEEALLEDIRHGNMLRLTLAFGLRKKEQLRIKLWKADKGLFLEIDGSVAKNGKFRAIPIDLSTDYGRFQRWCLDEAKKVCKKSETLGWPELNYKQAENRYYHFMRKLGATRMDIGVVGHGLRAEFFENQAMLRGMLPPCLGGRRDQMDKEAMAQVNLEVSQLGGHDNAHTISAYYGSLRKIPRSDGRGERLGGLAIGESGDLIAGIYVNPPVMMTKDGQYRVMTASECADTAVTIVKEQIGVKAADMSIHEFVLEHPELAERMMVTLTKVGIGSLQAKPKGDEKGV